MDDPRLVLIGRRLAEAARRKLTAAAAREAFEAELQAVAERLAATGGPLPREEASMAERLAVLTYLPQYLTAAEIEGEAAAIDAWFEQRFGRRASANGRDAPIPAVPPRLRQRGQFDPKSPSACLIR
jgi:hypothetical protein